MANVKLKSIKFPDLPNTYTAPQVPDGTEDNVALLDGAGNIKDSGKSFDDVAKVDGVYSGMSVGHANTADEANSLATTVGVTDQTPFSAQPVGGTSDVTTTYQKLNKLVGCKVVKNQFAKELNGTNWNTSSANASYSSGVATLTAAAQYGRIQQSETIVDNHKYFMSAEIKLTTASADVRLAFKHTGNYPTQGKKVSETTSWQVVSQIIDGNNSYNGICVADYRTSSWDSFEVKNIFLVDLTLRYGNNDVVDAIIGNASSKYVENLIAFDPNILKDTAYDTGSFSSCKSAKLLCKRFNQYNGSRRVGTCNSQTGIYDPTITSQHCSEMIRVIPNKQYHINNGAWNIFLCYDANENYLGTATYSQLATGGYLLNFHAYTYFVVINFGTRAEQSYCLSIYWDGSRLTPEEYKEDEYVLPNKDMNGILKVVNGKVVADGDEVYPSGEGNAKWYKNYTFTGEETFIDRGTNAAGLQIYVVDSSTFANYKYLINGCCSSNKGVFLGTSDSTASVQGFSDGKGFRVYENSSNQQSKYIYFIGFSLSEIVGFVFQYKIETAESLTASTFPSTFYGDDFGTMWFLDEDGNVIDGLQGNEIFYKANVAGFAESLYIEADGDPEYFAAAEDLTDAALAERGYYKMQDLSSQITDVAGLIYQYKTLYKVGNIVTLTIVAEVPSGSSVSSSTTLFTLPSGAYPVPSGGSNTAIPVRMSGKMATATISSSTGAVTLTENLEATNSVCFAFSYIV